MKYRSIMHMLEEALPALSEGEPEARAADPAERLGRAMLDRLGIPEGLDEDELVDALLDEWMNGEDEEEPEEEEEDDEEELPVPRGDAPEDLFTHSRRPVPMRAGAGVSSPVDYQDMSAEQFRNLKKFMKKASADGKRIRL